MTSSPSVHEQYTAPVTAVEVITPDDTERWAEASAIEAAVFIDADYVESAEELAEEYKPYLPASKFFAMTEDGEIRGVVRIIDHSEAGFKTIVDAQKGLLQIDQEWQERISAEQEHMFEVGTIAVPRQFRTTEGGKASIWLYGAILGYSRKHNMPSALASFDAKYFEGFTKSLFQDGVEAIGDPIDYMGSYTTPAYMREREAYASIRSVDVTGEIVEVLDRGAEQIMNA